MVHVFFVVVVFVVLFIIMAACVAVGRRYGCKQVETHHKHKLEVVDVAESAVFALLGLLIAFTFSGAYDRYEQRKLHILQEANVYDTAYEYIDLLPVQYQPQLRSDVRQFLDLHLATYNDIPFAARVNRDLGQAIIVQHRIWKTLVAGSQGNPNNDVFIPAFSKMFEITHEGINMTLIHPPAVIFLLLVGLAALGAFLVGYNSAETTKKYPLHMLCYVLLTTFTIFIIINLEFPRVGFIRFSSFDQMLVDVRNDMTYGG